MGFLLMSLWRRYATIPIIISLLVFLTACEEKNNQYIEPPPAEVTVAKATQQKVIEYLEFTGTTKSVGFAEVRARVSGILTEMHFEPGVKVSKGDLLFIIDPKPYKAELAAAKAELVSAKAEASRTRVELKRADELIKKNFISRTDHLKRKTERDVARASIGLKTAKVDSAEIQLSYTRVTAPISGRISRNFVDVGNLVGEGEATLLTSITQYKPMYAYFHLNERDLLRLMKLHRKEAKESNDDTPRADAEIPVQLGLADEEGYPHQGILDFGESSLDAKTGTIELRALFANAETPARLLPGLFARLRLPVDDPADALLIQEQAISSDQSGRYLLLVNNENKVEKRLVTLGQHLNGLVVIKKGLKAEDSVIINGLQKARPGSVVNPQPARAG